MEISPEELEAIINNAVTKALALAVKEKPQVKEILAGENINIADAFIGDELTDEELLFWSTPHFDVLKEEKNKLTKE